MVCDEHFSGIILSSLHVMLSSMIATSAATTHSPNPDQLPVGCPQDIPARSDKGYRHSCRAIPERHASNDLGLRMWFEVSVANMKRDIRVQIVRT